ncbi:MAG: hypothetical protein KF841_02005 [Phycisphaerae bacterium]|nr:hypothetical protein [Phycisphaerae bacterium]
MTLASDRRDGITSKADSSGNGFKSHRANASWLRVFAAAFSVIIAGGASTAYAGPEDNIRANALAVEQTGTELRATLDYSIIDLLPIIGTPLNPFTIEIGLDFDGDQTPEYVLYSFSGQTVGTTFVGHVWSQNILPDLNALPLSLRMRNGARLIARLDTANTNNELWGAGEADNFAASAPFFVDLRAKSLVLDGANQATLTYLVDSPAAIHDSTIQFYLDDNPQNGALDPTDSLVAVVNIDGTPGIRSAMADYTGLVPASGQMIFARLDTGDAITEADESNNEIAGINAQSTDLIAISLQYDETTRDATLHYFVNSPTDVAAYDIEFFLDRDNSGSPTPGDAPVVATVTGDVTPGPHSATVNFTGNAPISNQFIHAWIDRVPAGLGGQVAEQTEVANNIISTARTFTTDLSVTSFNYDANTGIATLSYLVKSPTPVAPYAIVFSLDRDRNGSIGVADLPNVALVIGATSPGAHTATAAFVGINAPASNQLVFATIDPVMFNQVVESDESGNNIASAVNTTPTDLIAVSLSYDDNLQKATLSYVVDAPIPVPAYSIEFYLDSDHSGTPSPADTLVALVPGNTQPGAHTLMQSYAASPADSGQLVFAAIDRPFATGGNVPETKEAENNFAATSNSATTDLIAVAMTYDANTQLATLAYTVQSPIPVAPFDIAFALDSDTDFAFSPADTTVATIAGQVTPGSHVQTISFGANPPASNQTIFAFVDATNSVAEIDESNNLVTTTNSAQTDIALNMVGSLNYDEVNEVAYLTYLVDSPINTPAYTITFIRDTDNSFTITPGDTIVGVQAGDTTPGLHTMVQSFEFNLVEPDQWIWAIADYSPPPFGNVNEINEFNNTSFTTNTDYRDLHVISFTYDSNTQRATFAYHVNSPVDVLPYEIRFYLESNGTPGLQAGSDQLVQVVAGEITPGGHAAIGDYASSPPASNQLIYVVLDADNQVAEKNETDNFAKTRNNTPTDLVAISLFYDSNTEEATLSYAVNAPIPVPAYNVAFYLDRDQSGALDVGDAPPVAIVSGNTTPGAYTLIQDFSGDVPGSNQFIFAAIDLDAGQIGAVVESDEFSNNLVSASNSLGTDLVAAQIAVHVDTVSSTTTADVAYAIYGPLPVAPFSVKVGVDRNADGVIDSAGDVLADVTVSAPGDLTPGVHSIFIPNFRAAINSLPIGQRIAHGDRIVATLDLTEGGTDAGAVLETEEIANNTTSTTVTVDLIANSLLLFLDGNGNQTRARVSFTVNSPGRVEPFNIVIGVDRDNNGIIDSPADVLTTMAAAPADLRPGAQSTNSADFRAALDAVSPALKQGDRIIAMIDLNGDATPSNSVIESAEVSNNSVSLPQRVDLVANAVDIITDTNAGTTRARVSYTIDSFGAVAPFSLKIGVDRNGDNRIDDPDGLLADIVIGGTELTPGAHTVNVPGLRAALNGLATPIKHGDVILATLDLMLDGNDQGAVREDIERNNNRVAQSQTVDLIANSIAIQSDNTDNQTIATIAYTVNSPANAAPFNIRVGVDRNGDNIIDADSSDLLAILSPSDRSPGSHSTTTGNLRSALANLVQRLGDGDRIIATIDILPDGSPANLVVEAVEIANNITSQSQSVDLVASAVEVLQHPGNGGRGVRVNYTVSSPGAVPPFTIRVGVDSDNDKIIDPGSILELFDLSLLADEKTRPGDRQVVSGDLTTALDALGLNNGDRIIATLDIADDGAGTPENLVVEGEEIQNNVTRSPQTVDLVAISLAFDSNTNQATMAYAVNSVGGVPSYEISFYLDNNPQNGLLDISDQLVGFVAGQTTPGEHIAFMDYSAHIPQTYQHIFAVVDDKLDVEELSETNNIAVTNNTEITDLIANALTVISDDDANQTTASVAYTINAPDAVPAFDIRIGVDRDGDDVIDSPTDVLAIVAAPDLSPGAHTAIFGNLRPSMEALAQRLNHGDRLIATLDLADDGTPANSVIELGGDESANNIASYSVIVDIVATAVEVFYRPSTGDTVARVNYIINSPGAVAPFFIRIGIDSDGDRIIDPGTLLETIDVAAIGPGKLRPNGDKHVVNSGDLLVALNALPTALQNGDRIIATIDILDDGAATPENLVVEENETQNNFAREPVTVDLVAQSIFLTADNEAGTTSATVVYSINSIGKAPPFTLRIGIDRDGDNLIDNLDAGDQIFEQTLTDVADLAPGEHVHIVPDLRGAINKLNPRLVDGDRIIATLDLLNAPVGGDEGAVVEIVEVGNNVTSAAGTEDQIIDLSPTSLIALPGSFLVNGTYQVTSPGNVPEYRIYVGRDTDGDDLIDDVLFDLPGAIEPGVHEFNVDLAPELRAVGIASGETVNVIMQLDPTNAVVERYENNNVKTATGDYLVDLVGRYLTHACAILDTPFDVTVQYDIAKNDPTETYQICLFASHNDDASIGPDDVLLGCVSVSDALNRTVGQHTVIIPGVIVSAADFVTNHFVIKAALDRDGVVLETDETNNVLVRSNGPMNDVEDSDADGTPDCFDACPADPNKTASGICGCGVSDTDTDGDGVADCVDLCPSDPNKIAPGVCGCSESEADSDGDGVPDCLDQCPNDAAKLEPGICGCGVVDSNADADEDGTPDCIDPAPNDPNVPVVQEPPAGQPNTNNNNNGNTGIRISVVQLIPGLPVCGVELCGTNLFAPLLGFLIGYGGLRRAARRQMKRRR